jgi:hypothetical protein
MKPVAKAASPAAVALLRQANALAPKRTKASDGLLPSAAHIKTNPNSDHNTGLAVDLTHDPKNGIDCKKFYKEFQKDKRVKYLIFNGKIWQRGVGEKKYTGANPHRTHLHVSIRDGYGTDVSPWFAKVAPVKKAPAKKPVVKKVAPKEPKPKYGKSLIGNILKRGTKAVCTCKTCPIHKKGK